MLGLHSEAVRKELRLWDPKTQKYLLMPDEKLAKAQRELLQSLVKLEDLRRENEALKQQAKKGNGHS